MMALLKSIGLFTFSHGGNQNKQGGGGVSLSGVQPFVVIWQYFNVAGRNFEEILQHLKKHQKDF